MKPILFVVAAAALVIGCQKSEDTAAAGTTGSAPAPKAAATPPIAPPAGPAPAGKYKAVQAIFDTNCIKCHGGSGRAKGGINLTNYDGVIKGGEEGAIVTAGKPDTSVIVMALHGKGAKQMPPRNPLSAADIATISDWIKAGAKNG